MTILIYNGQNIEQRVSDNFVNATEMCKANGKKINDWLRLEETKEYFEELSLETGIPASKLIVIVSEGFPAKKSTWIHPELAICLARWISIKFARWCDRHIKRLMDTGSTNLDIKPQNKYDMLRSVIDNLEAVENRQKQLEQEQQLLRSRQENISGELDRIFKPDGDYFSIRGYASNKNIKLTLKQANRLGRIAVRISKQEKIAIDKLPDPKYGELNIYHESVLEKVFDIGIAQ